MMTLRNYRIIAMAFCLLVSCGKDDDVSSSSGIYGGAISSASASALMEFG